MHNITFHVDERIEKEWVATIAREYIPLVKRAVPCSRALFTRVRVAGEDSLTFSLQLFLDNDEEGRRPVDERLEESLAALSLRFPGGFLYFRATLEEVVHET
ncbi:MAG: DUF4286 family protein [Odoribacteraceae bacterium]|nr:DUF4286 family protein [Odoribacteraceae bacterium]